MGLVSAEAEHEMCPLHQTLYLSEIPCLKYILLLYTLLLDKE